MLEKITERAIRAEENAESEPQNKKYGYARQILRNLFLNNTAAYGNTPRDKKTDINKAAQIGEQNKIIIAVSDETKSICNCNRKHDSSDYRQSFLLPFSHTAYLIFHGAFSKSLYHNARLISTGTNERAFKDIFIKNHYFDMLFSAKNDIIF